MFPNRFRMLPMQQMRERLPGDLGLVPALIMPNPDAVTFRMRHVKMAFGAPVLHAERGTMDDLFMMPETMPARHVVEIPPTTAWFRHLPDVLVPRSLRELRPRDGLAQPRGNLDFTRAIL